MSVPGNLYTPTIRKTRGGDYLIEQSLLLNDNDSAYLSRTPSTAGNRKTWTFSCWFKRGNLTASTLLSAGADTSNYTRVNINGSDKITINYLVGGSSIIQYVSTPVFRDTSSWYHIVASVDTTEATSTNRVKVWVNGTQITNWDTSTAPSQNTDTDFNSTDEHNLGRVISGAYSDLLMALPILVDGAALDPTSFGEEDADGYWNPIEFTGATGFSGNAFTGGTASASSGTAANAFDNNDATNWFTSGEGQGASAWLQYDLGAGNTAHIRALSILTANGGGIYMWATFKLQYSDNGSTWTDVSELGADTTLDRSGTLSMYYEFEETGEHRYWRLQGITGANSPGEPTIATLVGHTEFVNGYGTNGFALDFNNSSFFGQDVKQEFTAPSVAFTDSAYDTTNTTSYTFSSMDIGVADADRYVYACVGSSNAAVAVLTFQTVTIGGVSATLLGASNADPANSLQPYAIYVAKVPSGTTADVVVTLNSSPANCAVALYRAVGVGLGYVDLQADNGTSPNSVSVGVPTNGFILAHGNKNGQTVRVTLTGVTEQYDFGGESDMAIFGGLNTAAGGTTQTVTASTATGSYFGHLAVTIPPAGDNSYIANNFTAADQLADTPTDSTDNETGNWMTMSPINTNTNVTFSEDNMRLVGSGGDKRTSISSMVLPSTGKFYFEAYWNSYAGDSGIGFMDTNVMNTSTWRTDANGFPGGAQNTDGYAANDGPNYYVDGGGAVSLTSPSATNYQQLAIDMDTGEVWYGINNTWLNSGNPAAGTGEVGTFDAANLANGLFFITSLRLGADVTLNFGQRAFNYTPPTGFTGLSHTANYPDPTIAKPSDYMNTVLYTGNGTAIGSGGQSITGVGFQPDFVWIKERTNTSPPVIVDAVRGVTKFLRTSDTTAEDTNTESLTEFNTDGFTVGNAGAFNQSAEDYVAWCWKANGAAVSNTDGSTTSSVSVNTTSGFSIVSYTGTGVAATIGHGLGVAPKLMIVKNRDATQNWRVYTAELGATKYLNLNTTAAQDTDANQWNNTEPTSSVFSVGTSGPTNGSTNDIIAYCWAEVEGFSKFGSYTGNGSTDGPFVYCGFRPAFVLIKRTNTTGDWTISDNKRDTYNPTDLILKPNTTQVDISGGNELDFNANGFKVRNLGANRNASGGTYIFAAYAEHPFQGDDGYTQGRAR